MTDHAAPHPRGQQQQNIYPSELSTFTRKASTSWCMEVATSVGDKGMSLSIPPILPPILIPLLDRTTWNNPRYDISTVSHSCGRTVSAFLPRGAPAQSFNRYSDYVMAK